MFGSSHNGANAYATVGVETGVTSASAHELIVMLFDGAMIALTTARQHMETGNIPAKGQAISKAIMIIESGLRASLNKEVGGEIAQNLDSLYEYMSRSLVMANVKNKPEVLDEVHGLLKELKEAWQAIGATSKAAAMTTVETPKIETPSAPPFDAPAANASRLMKAYE